MLLFLRRDPAISSAGDQRFTTTPSRGNECQTQFSQYQTSGSVAQHRLTARQRTRPRHCHTRCLAGRPGSPSRPGWRTGADRSPVAAVTARGSGRVRCCRAPSRRYEPARQHRTCSRQRLVRGTGALLSPGRLDCEPVEVTAPAMPARDLGRFRPYRPQQIGSATEALRRANRTRSSCRAERSFTGR